MHSVVTVAITLLGGRCVGEDNTKYFHIEVAGFFCFFYHYSYIYMYICKYLYLSISLSIYTHVHQFYSTGCSIPLCVGDSRIIVLLVSHSSHKLPIFQTWWYETEHSVLFGIIVVSTNVKGYWTCTSVLFGHNKSFLWRSYF